eukprot:CAMPEP_0202752324 /NCGR_PEP_ID=MMETSP1388-20130828/12758_1 /ASSEMBLY_ACC=CAM_ASM_000864 /TAXON_ID=37098 /ORGANISM="Isochrysis sp, Strain CCMP1244" /LENGTH=44 /DNA_ID= /DNA_START= /DNA_END= /DNA_ORIENTATION=
MAFAREVEDMACGGDLRRHRRLEDVRAGQHGFARVEDEKGEEVT